MCRTRPLTRYLEDASGSEEGVVTWVLKLAVVPNQSEMTDWMLLAGCPYCHIVAARRQIDHNLKSHDIHRNLERSEAYPSLIEGFHIATFTHPHRFGIHRRSRPDFSCPTHGEAVLQDHDLHRELYLRAVTAYCEGEMILCLRAKLCAIHAHQCEA